MRQDFNWPLSWFCFANLATLHWAKEEVLSYDFNSLQRIKYNLIPHDMSPLNLFRLEEWPH